MVFTCADFPLRPIQIILCSIFSFFFTIDTFIAFFQFFVGVRRCDCSHCGTCSHGLRRVDCPDCQICPHGLMKCNCEPCNTTYETVQETHGKEKLLFGWVFVFISNK